MSLTISESGSTDFPKLEKGIYQGTCFRIVDLGTSDQTYGKEVSKKTRLCITFEITDAVDPETNETLMEDGRPYAVSKTYTASLHEAAALRKHLESWRGKSFTDEELGGFDVTDLLGCTARIEVGHTEASAEHAGGNPKILNLQRPDGGVQKIPTKNEQQAFDLAVYCEEFKGNQSAESKAMCDIFDALAPWQQADIEDSYEYKAANDGNPDIGKMSDDLSSLTEQTAKEQNSEDFEEKKTTDDDIPF